MMHSPQEVFGCIHPYCAVQLYKHLFPGISQTLIGKGHFKTAQWAKKSYIYIYKMYLYIIYIFEGAAYLYALNTTA